jgi:hypothetical protein
MTERPPTRADLWGLEKTMESGRPARAAGGRWRRTASRALSCLALVVVLTSASGCGATNAREDLGQAVEDTQAAVRSVELAVDLLRHGQTSEPATEVTSRDMSDQIAKAQQQLVDVPGPTPELRALRERTLTAIGQAQVAVQEVTDVLSTGEDPSSASAQLVLADRSLQEVATAIGDR